MHHAIEATNLTKIYSAEKNRTSKPALDSLDMIVEKGSIFGLLGPNGAGKSTLINILAGTVSKTSGQASIMGYDIDYSPKLAKKQIGVVPQEIVYDSFFPISQTLEFTAGYYGIRPEERKTEEILKAVGLFDKKDAFPRQLSGGMKRRFLVAKAIVHSPNVVILDEPTAGVDIELRDQLWEYIKKLRNQGTTIIITTHYLAEAQELCDEIAFINNGRIIKQDLKEHLLSTFGSKSIYIEFAEPIINNNSEAKIPNIQADFLTKYQCEILSDHKIHLQCDMQKCGNLNGLLSEVQALNLPITDFKVSEPNLETIFKSLMKK